MSAVSVEEWTLHYPDEQIEEMRRRLRQTRFPASTCHGWTGGVDIDFLRRFTKFLADEYSWESDSARFGGNHFMVNVPEGGTKLAIHYSLPLGHIAGARPIVLLHGWPSSSFEFVHVAELFRGSGFMPVLVDLPGFGFSSPTLAPMGPRAIAGLLRRALVEGAGLHDMVVHGNDWGSTIASWLAIDHADILCGIHLSMTGLRPSFPDGTPPPSDAELAWIKVVQKKLAKDAGYREMLGTKPNTAAIGLVDSPAALAAWIVEKFHGWNGGGATEDPPVSLEDLAAIVTGYWLSGAIPSANWIYSAVRAHDDTVAPVGGTRDVPVGFSLFGNGFFPAPPESWARRMHNVTDYSIHNTGGHYPALMQPKTLAQDILRFTRSFD